MEFLRLFGVTKSKIRVEGQVKNQVAAFLVRLAWFLLPVLAVLGYLEFRLASMPNSYNTKKKYIEHQLDSIEVLVLGSSQSLHAIDPSCFGMYGFNLSNASQTLFYDRTITEIYLDKMPRLKIVFISLSYFSFGCHLADTREYWRDYFYYRFWNIADLSVKKYDTKALSYIALYGPMTALAYTFKNFDAHLTDGLQHNGWLKTDAGQYDQINNREGKSRAELHTNEIIPGNYPGNIAHVEILIAECKKRGIVPVLLTTPVYKTYAKYVHKNIEEKNSRIIRSLSKKYNISYYNYFNDNRFNISDFKDNDHLNQYGAAKFSKMIEEEILKPLSTKPVYRTEND